MVEVVLAEHLREDVVGQDVLDQHLPHIGLGEIRVDRFVSVLQKDPRRLAEGRAFLMRFHDHCPQGFKDGGEVSLELIDGLVEFKNLDALVREEQRQQLLELRNVFD